MKRLNLGSGDLLLDGYDNLDGGRGDQIYPLTDADGSVDEIRASHVLEHFGHQDVVNVMADWVRALKPGGLLKIAVPDFEWIASNYLDGKQFNVQGYLMGGQVDHRDYHKCVFDGDVLRELMKTVGLIDIRPWKSDANDCASLPVSLNLQGTKPATDRDNTEWKIGGAMSTPRLGFMDNFFCAYQSLVPLKIGLRKHTGAFWGQCLERTIDEWIADGATHILTLDYDTIFRREQVEALITLMREHPEADAIAPLQASRTKSTPLFTIKAEDGGGNMCQVPRTAFDAPLVRAGTAHFGLTLIKVDAIKRMARPLFKGVPAPDSTWGDGRTDDDIWFWQQFERAGLSLYIAPRVVVGHAELMVRWPDQNLEPMYQHPADFFTSGIPEGVWK